MSTPNQLELTALNHCMARDVMGWTLEHGYWVAGQVELDAELDFKPATNKHDALRVLEKICNRERNDCKDVGIGYCPGMEWAGGNWCVYMIYRENPGHLGIERVNAETLALAICRYAKYLTGVEPWPVLNLMSCFKNNS